LSGLAIGCGVAPEPGNAIARRAAPPEPGHPLDGTIEVTAVPELTPHAIALPLGIALPVLVKLLRVGAVDDPAQVDIKNTSSEEYPG